MPGTHVCKPSLHTDPSNQPNLTLFLPLAVMLTACRLYKQARNGANNKPKPRKWELIKKMKWDVRTAHPTAHATHTCVRAYVCRL